MSQRIVIDPVTRIEGHLRIECTTDSGHVTEAKASGQMFRGIETILRGRDPREAWIFTQRICGVCTTVHAIASVRAVENALKIEIPENAQHIRNIITAAHAVHDHIVHFYHLSALDWVDVTQALKADPIEAERIAYSLSEWPFNGRAHLKGVQDRLKGLVESGRLGIFSGGYWGHPAMRLEPEVNLLAVAHYLQALDVQRKANQIVAILGGKTPHIQNLAVGGVANPLNLEDQSAFNMERIALMKTLAEDLGNFIDQVYIPDVLVIAARYPEWFNLGKTGMAFLSVPEMPLDSKGTAFAMPGGYLPKSGQASFQPITSFQDAFFEENVKEAVDHSWYRGRGPVHPYKEETEPDLNQDKGRYSWIKSPTFQGKPAEVGPLAHFKAMLEAGHEPAKRRLDKALGLAHALLGKDIPLEALDSTLGRHLARSLRCSLMNEELGRSIDLLIANLAKGDTRSFDPPTFPKGEIQGFGFLEAPRGMLSHWVIIKGGKIQNYQVIAPTTWNAAPRNTEGEPGPYEASLVGTPIADDQKPLEILRTIHSFDPCLACSVHLIKADGTDSHLRIRPTPEPLGG